MSEVTLIGLTIAILSIVGILYPHVIYPACCGWSRAWYGQPVLQVMHSRSVDVVDLSLPGTGTDRSLPPLDRWISVSDGPGADPGRG